MKESSNRYLPNKINLLRQKNQFRKLSDEDVVNIRNKISAGERIALIAQEYGMSISSIYKIKQNKRWKFLSLETSRVPKIVKSGLENI